MPTKEKQLPHARSIDSLIRGFEGTRIVPFTQTELRKVELQLRDLEEPTNLDLIHLMLENMDVVPGTRLNAVAFFLLESPKQGYRTSFERKLHERFNLRTEEATRPLVDAANEQDILDLQRQLSLIALEQEYTSGVRYAQMQIDDLEQRVHDRTELRKKIREKASPSTPQTRA